VKVEVEIHPTLFIIILTGKPLLLAELEEADLVLCAVKVFVLIPAFAKSVFNYLEIVSLLTGLKGFW
jgi:hypothetical protein